MDLQVGARLKKLRTGRGWTQAELAQRAGVRRATVVGWENGNGTERFLDTLTKLARALECAPVEILGGVAPSPAKRKTTRA